MTGCGYAAASYFFALGDDGFLAPAVPADGRVALVIGGLGIGGLTGLMVPVVLLGAVRGSAGTPRLTSAEAATKIALVLCFDVYLAVVAVLAAQAGWLLGRGGTVLLAVFFVGFSWVPLALVPWEKFGLSGVDERLRGSRKRARSVQQD
jgi:hypothetical protein